jgi:hypothetical protein
VGEPGDVASGRALLYDEAIDLQAILASHVMATSDRLAMPDTTL